MTQHVQNGYRKHRKVTWVAGAAVALALTALTLVLVLPALGATSIPPPSGDGVLPTDVNVGGSNFNCTTNTGGVPAGLQTFTVSSPPNSNASVTYNSTNTATSPTPLPAGVSFILTGVNGPNKGKFFSFQAQGSGVNVAVFHVGVKGGSDVAWYDYYDYPPTSAGVTSDTALHATVKDPSTGALYNASYTTFCYALTTTISGRVFEDRNGDGVFTTGTGSFSDVAKAWSVNLFQKPAGSGSFSSTPFMTLTSNPDGTYMFSGVPTGADYKVCVKAVGATDTGQAWGLRTPTGNTLCDPISNGSDLSAANVGGVLSNLSSAATGQDFAAVPVTGSFGAGDTSQVTDYSVYAGSNTSKLDQRYVQESWVDDQGRTNFRFAPLTPCTGCGQIYLLETLDADISFATLNGDQAELLYNDDLTIGTLKPMPYCLTDPTAGQTGGALATSGVLPGTDTSCIVTGQQTVVPAAGTVPAHVHVTYHVYTARDSGRQIG